MRRSALFIAVSSTFTLACIGGDKLGRGDDTASEDDSGGGGGARGGLCGEYSGVEGVGTTWEYNYNDSQGSTGPYVVEVTAIDGKNVELVSTLNIEGTTYSQDSTTTSQYRCGDEGMVLLSSYNFYDVIASGYEYSGWTDTTYTNGALTLPRTLEVGTTWVSDQSNTYTDSNGGDGGSSDVYTFEVTAEEDVNVPAGAYTALRVETAAYSGASHYVEGVGFVKTDYFQLTRYSK
ncbi:MAG: hypothetical protein RIT28_3692 [Pseudomonadota bacterium]|jgi:hypothetical protein